MRSLERAKFVCGRKYDRVPKLSVKNIPFRSSNLQAFVLSAGLVWRRPKREKVRKNRLFRSSVSIEEVEPRGALGGDGVD